MSAESWPASSNYNTSWFKDETAAGGDVYHINSAEDLAALSYEVAYNTTETHDFAGKNIILTKSIDLNEHEWTPIGVSGKPFKGNFDGDNKSILNLKITQNNDNQGLFGYVMNGNLSNLVISNVNITGSKKVGSLAGVIYHIDKNEHYITNCKVNGKVTGSGERVGGLTGTIDARTSRDMDVSLCSVNVSVTGTSLTGGLTGYCEAHIPTESTIPTNISISNCNIIGDVNGSENVGSISGKTYADGKCHIKITNCLVVSNVNGIKNVGGIVGHLNKNGDGIAEISHSIILSQYVNITTSSNVGRIVGLDEGTLSNNYAWKGMTNYSNLFTSETDTNKKNGTDAVSVQVWANKSFYQTLDWDFSNNWEIISSEEDDGNKYPLPYLKCFGRDDLLRKKVDYLVPTFYVKFDNNSGTGNMDEQGLESAKSLNLNANENKIIKRGYSFDGWNKTRRGLDIVADYEDNGLITINQNKTLYAVWRANTTNITLNYNNPSGSTSTTEVVTIEFNSSKLGKELFPPNYEGYAFVGYNNSSCGGVQVINSTLKLIANAPGYTTSDGKWNNTSDVTLWAVWTTENTVNITFKANCGVGDDVNQTIVISQLTALINPGFTRDGYEFIGWNNTSAEGTDVVFNVEDTINISDDAVLWAVWKVIPTPPPSSGDSSSSSTWAGGSNYDDSDSWVYPKPTANTTPTITPTPTIKPTVTPTLNPVEPTAKPTQTQSPMQVIGILAGLCVTALLVRRK